LGKASVALPYEKREGMVHALPPVRYPDWPAGLLRTSAADFARFVKIFCEQGTVAGRSYLRAATLAEFFSDQSVQVDEAIQQGLVWELRSRNGIHLASHFGGDPGAASFVCLDIDKRVGVFAFANITSDHAFLEFQRDVLVRLLKQARAGA
jgi:CubicO group peptidase (beta-lactamase class C family)